MAILARGGKPRFPSSSGTSHIHRSPASSLADLLEAVLFSMDRCVLANHVWNKIVVVRDENARVVFGTVGANRQHTTVLHQNSPVPVGLDIGISTAEGQAEEGHLGTRERIGVFEDIQGDPFLGSAGLVVSKKPPVDRKVHSAPFSQMRLRQPTRAPLRPVGGSEATRGLSSPQNGSYEAVGRVRVAGESYHFWVKMVQVGKALVRT